MSKWLNITKARHLYENIWKNEYIVACNIFNLQHIIVFLYVAELRKNNRSQYVVLT